MLLELQWTHVLAATSANAGTIGYYCIALVGFVSVYWIGKD